MSGSTVEKEISRVTHADGVWCVEAPAKLNLGLHIFPPRPDGFHDIESWMVPLSWHDTVHYHPEDEAAIRVTGRTQGIPLELEKNLVGRAMLSLATKAGRQVRGRIDLHKVVPPGGGLGGGSSDAGNLLVLLNEAWNLHWPLDELADVAAGLGSDVALFVHGAPALCTGRGEVITPLPVAWPLYAVLILPPEGLATKPVYAAFDAMLATTKPREIDWSWQRWATLHADALNEVLANDLETPAYSLASWLRELQRDAASLAKRRVHMTGSGSTLFTLVETAPGSAELAKQLQHGLAERAVCIPVRVLDSPTAASALTRPD